MLQKFFDHSLTKVGTDALVSAVALLWIRLQYRQNLQRHILWHLRTHHRSIIYISVTCNIAQRDNHNKAVKLMEITTATTKKPKFLQCAKYVPNTNVVCMLTSHGAIFCCKIY